MYNECLLPSLCWILTGNPGRPGFESMPSRRLFLNMRRNPHLDSNPTFFEVHASGSGDPAAPDTPHPPEASATGTPAPAPPRGAGHITEGWQSQDPSRGLPPRQLAGKTPNGPQAQAHQPRAQPRCPENAQQLTGPTPTEPPNHPPLPPSDHGEHAGGRCRRLAAINGARVAHPQQATRRIMGRSCQCRASAPGSKCHDASETSRLSRCRWPASRRVSCSIALDVVVDAALAQALRDARWVDDGICAVPLYSGMGRGHH